MRALAQLGILVAIAAACTSIPATSPSPTLNTSRASSRPSPNEIFTTAPLGSATAEPSRPTLLPSTLSATLTPAQPTDTSPASEPTQPASSAPPEPLSIQWRRQDRGVSLGLLGNGFQEPIMANAVVFDDRFVIAGRRLDLVEDDERLAIWTSPDGRYWQRGSVEGISAAAHRVGVELDLNDLAVGGPGLVAVGVEEECCGAGVNGAVWLSEDADTWTRAYDEDFHGTGGLTSVWSAGGQVYAYGDAGLFRTADGYEWTPIEIGDAPAPHVADPIKADESLTFVIGSNTEANPLELWSLETTGWSHVARLPDSDGASFQRGAGGAEGWVIMGERNVRGGRVESLTWVSGDGVTWQSAPTPPSAFFATDVITDEAGFVATGYEYPAGCAWSWSIANGRTWSSSDGLVWQQSSTEGWEGKFIGALLRSDRTLIGVGVDYDEDGYGNGAVWTAQLPRLVEAEPGAPAEPTQVGCG